MKRNQSGMTLIGFVIVLGIVGLFIYVGMKVVPMYTEYYSVKQALAGLAKDSETARKDSAWIRDRFFRRMDVSYVESVKAENLKIIRKGDAGVQITVEYEVRRPLIANLDVVGHFKAVQDVNSID